MEQLWTIGFRYMSHWVSKSEESVESEQGLNLLIRSVDHAWSKSRIDRQVDLH